MSAAPYRVVYLSSARQAFNADELANLLAHARRKNMAAGLSGLLLYHDGNFFQVLEGKREIVRAVMHEIMNDERHAGVIVLEAGECARRVFPDWSMGYVRNSELSTEQMEGFVAITKPMRGDHEERRAEGLKIKALIKTFLNSFRELETI